MRFHPKQYFSPHQTYLSLSCFHILKRKYNNSCLPKPYTQLQGRIIPETTWTSTARPYYQYWNFYGLCGKALLPITYFTTFTAARDNCAQTCETEWGGKHCTSFSIANVRNSGTNFSCALFSESPGNNLFWVSPVFVNNVHNTANVTSFVKKTSVKQLSSFSGTCPFAAALYPPF